MLLHVAIIVTCAMTSLTAQEAAIDVTILSLYLKQLKDETLGVGKVQEQVETLRFERHNADGSALVDQLASSISYSMTEHIKIVLRLKSSVEESLRRPHATTWRPCCEYDESLLNFNPNFKSEVDTSSMCEIIAPSAAANLQSLSLSVLEIMIENRRSLPSLKWQYVATREGVLTLFPAQRTRACSFIDPRFRPWYVETLRTRRNNVVVLLDVSRSMADQYNSQSLIDVAKQAIHLVLRVLTPDDRVGLVAFNNTVTSPGGCFKDGLALATETNLKALNESLKELEPKGESVYTVGFTGAFKLISSTVSRDNDTTGDWTILLISDGQPKEMHLNINKVYETIKAGNDLTGNIATLFVYGIGRNVNMNILRKIALQDFDDVINTSTLPSSRHEGVAFHVKEPSMLPNVVTLFNSNRGTSSASSNPVVSVPYVDGGGLGLIFTVGLPIVQNGRTFGVVAIDLALEDIFKEAMYLNGGQDAYVFVVDDNGCAITHPLMPQPANHSDPPNFIQIDQLERNLAFDDVMSSMMRRERGNKTFGKAEVLPIGDVIQVMLVNATYFWRPIEGTNFSICLVLRERGYNFTLPPEKVVSLLRAGVPMFRHHRLDLEVDTHDLCRHFYHKSTVTQSTALFAPRCFKDPFLFPQIETSSFVRSVTTFFNQLLISTSPDDIHSTIAKHAVTFDFFAQGVVSDVMWTTLVDALWVNHTDVHVANRYVGTRNGVGRIFPGAKIPGGFDVTTRIWYELAIANSGKLVVTPPYEDGAGAGNVISFSHEITIPLMTSQQENSSISRTREAIGVMGVDLSLDHLFSIVQSLYPNCKRRPNEGWYCMLVDNQGNIVLHPDYVSNSQQEGIMVNHIASDVYLMETLMAMKFATRRRCLDLDRKVYKSWYEINPRTFVNRINARDGLECQRYFMQGVPGTNMFFVARLNIGFCDVAHCPSSDDTCRNSNVGLWNEGAWECPCTYPLQFDACANAVSLEDGVQPCSAQQPPLEDDQECIPEQLPQCTDPACREASTSSNCSGLVGCVWCSKTLRGEDLLSPYCSPSEKCYDGLEGNKWIGYRESTSICEVPVSEISTLLLIIICVAATILLIGVLGCFICFVIIPMKRKAKKEAQADADEESNLSQFDDPLSHSSGRFSLPASPQSGSKANPNSRKQSDAPRVIITVVDSKGSEILKKPVQLIQGGKVYGAPPPVRGLRNEALRRKRSNSTPLLQKAFLRNRKRTEESEGSSINDSGIHSDSAARPSSTISESSAAFGFDRFRHRRSQSADVKNLPPAMSLPPDDLVFQRGDIIRQPCRSRDNLHQSKTQESEDFDSNSTPVRSASAANINDDCDVTMVKALRASPMTNLSKSVDNLVRSTARSNPSCYVRTPQSDNPRKCLHTHKHRHFSNPNYGGVCHDDVTNAASATDKKELSCQSHELSTPVYV